MLSILCSSLAATVPVQAVLFDIDGTLCDSDPLHHVAFQEMLLEVRISQSNCSTFFRSLLLLLLYKIRAVIDQNGSMHTQIGYNNGVPIDEEFFIKNIAGRSDVEAAQNLFPDWELEKGLKFLEDKEAKYRRYSIVLLLLVFR
jgi:phosphoglycolate phosphatase-like HAD superfamily hydrolase